MPASLHQVSLTLIEEGTRLVFARAPTSFSPASAIAFAKALLPLASA